MNNGLVTSEKRITHQYIIQFPTLVLALLINGYIGSVNNMDGFCDYYYINEVFDNKEFMIKSNTPITLDDGTFAPQYVVTISIGY